MMNVRRKDIGVLGRLISLAAMLLMCGSLAAQITAPAAWWNAITRDDAADVRLMLLRHVNPNAVNEAGLPSIMFAVREESWKAYDVLSSAPGIQVDASNRLDETALMYLSVLGETQRAKDLIAVGAQVNRLGWTPLHYAASKGRDETVRMLLAHEAIVNAPGPDGTTPLMMAGLSGRESTARLLLDHGADATMFNARGQTAADWARMRKHTRLADKLDALAARVEARRANPQGDAVPQTPEPAARETNRKSNPSYFDPDLYVDTPMGR